jgi:hypothetical protein
VTGCSRLHNEELHNLYASPNVIRMTNSRSIQWAGHVARKGETTKAYKRPLEDLGVDADIILE